MSRLNAGKNLESNPEFHLLVAACRRAFKDQAPSIAELEGADFDWPRLVRLAQFHRVEGLACRGLKAMSVAAPSDLLNRAKQIAARNLQAAWVCKDLLDRFTQADVPIIFVKGLALSKLVYGSSWVKAGVDIDLLTNEQHLEEATEILRRVGFHPARAAFAGWYALRVWHRYRKDSVWQHSQLAAIVDLHSRLTDNPSLIPAIGLHSPRQLVEIAPGIALPTLAKDELFAHLCVHGASSAWFRLKWICDFAALLQREGPAEVTRLYQRSQELGAGRAAAQALLLANSLFETLRDNDELRRSLQADNRARWLHCQAMRQLARTAEPTARPGGTWRIHLTQFFLRRGGAFKASELHRQVRAALRM
jgi:hypothetical protein